MKVLIAATPLTGHVNPLVAVGRLLKGRGDTVHVATDPAYGKRVEEAGLGFVPCSDKGAADYLEADLPPGPERWTHEFQHRFIDPMPGQAALLRDRIEHEAPDVIVAGSMFLGVLPLLLDGRPRPPVVVLNTSFLFLDRPDGAPVGLGLKPARDDAERARYAELKAGMDAAFVGPVRALADAHLAELGLAALPASLTQSIVTLPDAFLQPSVPGFEYDFEPLPETLRFVGLLPSGRASVPLPAWWDGLDRAAERDDLTVVATAGGRPVEAIRTRLPANAHVASYLPFGEVLPRIALLVTNGGYGSVSQALSAGVPIVAAGQTEDKAEVAARVGWSGVGIDLATNTPSVEALREAVGTVLSDARFRERAAAMGRAFAERDAGQEILAAIDALVRTPAARRA